MFFLESYQRWSRICPAYKSNNQTADRTEKQYLIHCRKQEVLFNRNCEEMDIIRIENLSVFILYKIWKHQNYPVSGHVFIHPLQWGTFIHQSENGFCFQISLCSSSHRIISLLFNWEWQLRDSFTHFLLGQAFPLLSCHGLCSVLCTVLPAPIISSYHAWNHWLFCVNHLG